MDDKIALTAMVLVAAPIGEADKRLVLLTKEKGKVTVFARGARRTGNPFLAAANTFAFGTFYVQGGRNSYRLAHVEIKNYFREISEEMEKACYGSYFLEFADYYARENDDGEQILKLLYAALRALLNPKLDAQLIRYVYELRMMAINGEYPQVFSCAICGKEKELCGYLPEKNSVLCKDCAKGLYGTVQIQESAVYAMQYVITAPMEKLFAFALTKQVMKEFTEQIDRFRRRYVDREFKSLEILDMMQYTRNILYKDKI